MTARSLNCDIDDRQITELLNEHEIEEFRQIFAIYDVDSDGRIPTCELTTILKNIGIHISEADLLDITGGKDLNTGSIDADVFLRIIFKHRLTSDPESDVRETFSLFDRDDDGFLTAKDLKQVMLNLGEKMTDEEIDEMVIAADKDKDGKVSYAEFSKMMATL